MSASAPPRLSIRELLVMVRELLNEEEEEEEKEPSCNKVNVVFDQIHVSNSQNDGFFGEPGPKAEWSVDFQVNGKRESWYSDQVQDNTQFHVGKDIGVDLADPRTSEIKVGVSGYEEDSSSANDSLPTSNDTHGSNTDWGIGQSFSIHGSNSTFAYTVDYRIECLYTRTSALSQTRAITAVESRLESAGVNVDDLDDDEVLTMFMDRARRDGYELKSSDNGRMIFEGPDSIREVVDEAFVERDSSNS
jgi:hypothetical protein